VQVRLDGAMCMDRVDLGCIATPVADQKSRLVVIVGAATAPRPLSIPSQLSGMSV